MSRFISQAPTLRQLARVYRRMLALSVPAASSLARELPIRSLPMPAGDPPEAAARRYGPALRVLQPHRVRRPSRQAEYADIWTGCPGGDPHSASRRSRAGARPELVVRPHADRLCARAQRPPGHPTDERRRDPSAGRAP